MATYSESMCWGAGPVDCGFGESSAKRREELGGLFIYGIETSIESCLYLQSAIYSHLAVV